MSTGTCIMTVEEGCRMLGILQFSFPCLIPVEPLSFCRAPLPIISRFHDLFWLAYMVVTHSHSFQTRSMRRRPFSYTSPISCSETNGYIPPVHGIMSQYIHLMVFCSTPLTTPFLTGQLIESQSLFRCVKSLFMLVLLSPAGKTFRMLRFYHQYHMFFSES
jgi:hypothetical protein